MVFFQCNFFLLIWVWPWYGPEQSLEKIRSDLVLGADVKCKQSEAERRLSNLELKAGLLPELRKIINTPKVRSTGKQVELNPSVKTRVPQDSWIWTGSWVPGQMNCPICYPWLAYQETQDPEKGRESLYTPEGGITQRLELLHLQKCWLGWVMAAPGDTSDKEPDDADVRDTGSIPGWGRAPEGGNGNPLHYSCLKNSMDRTRVAKSQIRLERLGRKHTLLFGGFPGSPVVKHPPANAEGAGVVGSVSGLGRSPGGGHGNPSSIHAWEIPWTEEPGGLQSTGSQRFGHNWVTEHTHTAGPRICESRFGKHCTREQY